MLPKTITHLYAFLTESVTSGLPIFCISLVLEPYLAGLASHGVGAAIGRQPETEETASKKQWNA